MNSALPIEPAAIPFPAASNGINECGEHQGEDHEFTELDSLGHQSGNDRGSGSGEGRLEQEINGGDQASVIDDLCGDCRVKEKGIEVQPLRE